MMEGESASASDQNDEEERGRGIRLMAHVMDEQAEREMWARLLNPPKKEMRENGLNASSCSIEQRMIDCRLEESWFSDDDDARDGRSDEENVEEENGEEEEGEENESNDRDEEEDSQEHEEENKNEGEEDENLEMDEEEDTLGIDDYGEMREIENERMGLVDERDEEDEEELEQYGNDNEEDDRDDQIDGTFDKMREDGNLSGDEERAKTSVETVKEEGTRKRGRPKKKALSSTTPTREGAIKHRANHSGDEAMEEGNTSRRRSTRAPRKSYVVESGSSEDSDADFNADIDRNVDDSVELNDDDSINPALMRSPQWRTPRRRRPDSDDDEDDVNVEDEEKKPGPSTVRKRGRPPGSGKKPKTPRRRRSNWSDDDDVEEGEESDEEKAGPSGVQRLGRPPGGSGRKTKKEQMRVAQEKGTFRCDFPMCNRICGDKRLLDQHKVIHMRDKMHQCSFCIWCFHTKERLAVHIKKVHPNGEKITYTTPKKLARKGTGPTKDRPHACDHCGHAFTRVIDLNKHIATHTGSRPLKCDFCETWHIDLALLKQHQQRQHFIKNFECPTCNEMFMFRQEMLSHREEKHGWLRISKVKALRKQGHMEYRWDKVNKCPFPIKK